MSKPNLKSNVSLQHFLSHRIIEKYYDESPIVKKRAQENLEIDLEFWCRQWAELQKILVEENV